MGKRSINDILQGFAERLESLGVPTYHYFVPANTDFPYARWQEQSSRGDDIGGETAVTVEIDLYTKVEYDDALDRMEEAFPGLSLVETNYYNDIRVVCHTLSVEVC